MYFFGTKTSFFKKEICLLQNKTMLFFRPKPCLPLDQYHILPQKKTCCPSDQNHAFFRRKTMLVSEEQNHTFLPLAKPCSVSVKQSFTLKPCFPSKHNHAFVQSKNHALMGSFFYKLRDLHCLVLYQDLCLRNRDGKPHSIFRDTK